MSFRCRRCHKVGHLYNECPLVFKTTSPSKKSSEGMVRDATSAPGLNPYENAPETKKGATTQVPSSNAPHSPSPMMTRSRATAAIARSSSTPPLPCFEIVFFSFKSCIAFALCIYVFTRLYPCHPLLHGSPSFGYLHYSTHHPEPGLFSLSL